MSEGPMNLGPKDELLPVRRDTLESLLVALQLPSTMSSDVRRERRHRERERLRRILREGGEA